MYDCEERYNYDCDDEKDSNDWDDGLRSCSGCGEDVWKHSESYSEKRMCSICYENYWIDNLHSED